MVEKGTREAVDEILVLFDRAVSESRSYAALRSALEKSPPMARYLRLLAADQGRVDADAAKALAVSVAEIQALQKEALSVLRLVVVGSP